MKNRDFLYPHKKCLCVPTTNPPLSLNFTRNLRSRLYSVQTSRETDFRKLKITLVTMTYHSQHPQCSSLSPHVLLAHVDTSYFYRLNCCIKRCYVRFIQRLYHGNILSSCNKAKFISAFISFFIFFTLNATSPTSLAKRKKYNENPHP